MGLRVSTATTTDELQRLSGEWRALLARAKADMPFLWPDWVLAWWETFHAEQPLVRDSLHVEVVRRPDGELVAVVPFMRTDRPGLGPVRLRTLGFLGSDRYLTEQRAPVVDPSCGPEAAAALATHLLADDSWDWVVWEGLDRHDEVSAVLDRAMSLRWGHYQPANVLPLAPSWDQFRGGLKRNIKESLRRCYNSLKRDNLVARLVVADTADAVDAALQTFFDLHAMRAHQADMVVHPDRFAGARAKQFLRLVCARFAERGAARVFTLEVGGAPVASRVGFVVPGCLYLYYSGFDPTWARYSVATTMVAEAIKYAITSGCDRVHLSMGSDASKSRWGPKMPVFHQATWVRPGLGRRTAFDLYQRGRGSAGFLKASSFLRRRFD